MEEIDILDFVRYYKTRFFIVIISILLVFIGGNIYTRKIRVPLYKSETTVVLVSDTDKTYTQSDLNFNKNLVTTYSNIVKSKKVLNTVNDKLHLDYSYGKLNKMVSVSSFNNTEIMKVTVSSDNPTISMTIANEIVPVFSEEVKRIYGINNVSVVDAAEESSNPYNVNVAKENAIFVIGGLLLGSLLIFVIYYFDTSVKSEKDLEDKLGLTVLGMVPKIESRDKNEKERK